MLMTACPSPELLDLLVNGRLGASDRAAVDAHVRSCAACRQTVATLGKGPTPEPGPDPPPTVVARGPEHPPPPPELRDHPRYRGLRLLDVGGMGAVYRAEHRLLERS